ncbi:hypothetical protein AVEN_9320-1 [Araneus ventricosus]|uniref:Uncharacterized protein n=1 Tax=Araneus ventricosus TaxID=182803 RepID=A0A4Y2VXB8_ARAVE|nr:hypothetical protein AVEN_9320-1 [Araneus ventricosus]
MVVVVAGSGCGVRALSTIGHLKPMSRLGTRNYRSMRFAERHNFKGSSEPKDAEPKCLHCSDPHTANFTGCPFTPIRRRPFSAAPENA